MRFSVCQGSAPNVKERQKESFQNPLSQKSIMGAMKEKFLEFLEDQEIEEPLPGDLALELVSEDDETITFTVVESDEDIAR